MWLMCFTQSVMNKLLEIFSPSVAHINDADFCIIRGNDKIFIRAPYIFYVCVCVYNDVKFGLA